MTGAEPDLQVWAANVPSIDTTMLIVTVSVGVGLFLTISMLRILPVSYTHLDVYKRQKEMLVFISVGSKIRAIFIPFEMHLDLIFHVLQIGVD